MKLKNLSVERKWFGKDKGKLVGAAEFDNELGSVALVLSPEQCDEIFRVCAEGVMTVAKTAAQELSCAVIEHQEKLT